jgi:hypothetical protein
VLTLVHKFQSIFLYLAFLHSNKSYDQFFMNHSFVTYDVLIDSFVEQYVYHGRYSLPFANEQGRETRILQSDALV